LLLPALLIIGVFILYPIIKTLRLAVMDYSLLRPSDIRFVFLDNFFRLLKEKIFFISLQNAVTYAFLTVLLQFVLGFWLALLLKNMKSGKGLYRTVIFSPWAVSGVLTSVIWSLMYNNNFGFINDFLLRTHLISEGIIWKGTPENAMFCVIIAATWRGIPYFAISLLACLLSVPNELYQAAWVDGAGAVKSFFYVTLPFARETIFLTTLLRFIWTFNDVDIIYSMTGGGPNNGTLTLPVYIVQEAVNKLNFGYAAALTVCLFVILLIFSIVYLHFGKSDNDFSA